MTSLPVAIVNSDSGMDRRWRDWQARGVEHDRQRTVVVTAVGATMALGFVVWIAALYLR